MKEQKKQLRKQIREEKKCQSADVLMVNSSTLLEQIEKHPRFIASNTILCYHSLSDEVQTHAFVEKWYTSKKILLPIVRGDILELRHYTGKDCLEVGAFGIEEPTGENFTRYEEIEFGITARLAEEEETRRKKREAIAAKQAEKEQKRKERLEKKAALAEAPGA